MANARWRWQEVSRLRRGAAIFTKRTAFYLPMAVARLSTPRPVAQCQEAGRVWCLLKPLDAALADGDYVHAVIKGSAINNDGTVKVGYTAPSVEGQRRVIVDALSKPELIRSRSRTLKLMARELLWETRSRSKHCVRRCRRVARLEVWKNPVRLDPLRPTSGIAIQRQALPG